MVLVIEPKPNRPVAHPSVIWSCFCVCGWRLSCLGTVLSPKTVFLLLELHWGVIVFYLDLEVLTKTLLVDVDRFQIVVVEEGIQEANV